MSVFLGWKPDAATQAALATLQHRIRAELPADASRHEWRVPAQWHITLRYLGDDIDTERLARLHVAMEAFANRTHALDAFVPGAREWPEARVLVATIDPSPALSASLSQLEALAQGCGFAPRHAQIPHVTLAYLAHDAPPSDLRDLAAATLPVHIDRVDLLQTAPGGYISLASWRLGPGTTAA